MPTEAASFTPREIVSELDRYIIGQHDAKRAVAIALRNRWRRQQLPDGLRDEVQPKNILMIGPTGVGKTEIARRLARLAQAPFLKVEATKFTEVGYVGRDVDQIVRDLVEISLSMTRDRLRKEVQAKAEAAAEERVIDALVGDQASADTRSKFRQKLRAGELNEREIELQMADGGRRHADHRYPRHAGCPGRHDQSLRHVRQGDGRPHQDPQDDGRGKPHRAGRGRERQAARQRDGDARSDPCGRAERHRLHRRDRQDLRTARIVSAPMSAAKACSGTCCR